MSTNKKTNELNSLKKPSKNMEINMSTLSTAQKQMCLKLLAESNINFEEANDQNCFEAELRIDPSKMVTDYCEEKEKQPKVSPIKKRQPAIQTVQMKQNFPKTANTKFKQQQAKEKVNFVKPVVHPIYTNSKKSLGKTVKLNNLSQLQRLHPFVELYVYPKKMSFQPLIELIEEIYETYWSCEIHGKNNKRRQNKVEESLVKQQSKNSKNNPKGKNIASNPPQQVKVDNKKSFCEWVYGNFISVQKEKMKVEQLLVNLVESLNHFSFKHIGIQMFHNFLSGVYSPDTLNYFLVIRALLQQIEGEKIIEKVSNYGSKAGVLYKMKLNPYNKFIEEEKVLDFLQVCCQSSTKQTTQDQTVNAVFQEMTEQMFFDEKKRKNFIHYFEMTDIFLKQFLKVETVNTTNLELSVTQQNSSMNDFLFKSQLQSIMPQDDEHQEENVNLTFEVHQVEEKSQADHIDSDDDLNGYLPNLELQINPSKDRQHPSFQQMLRNEVYAKFLSIHRSFSNLSEQILQNLESKQILQTLIQSVVKGDKKRWIDFIRTRKVNPQRESQELHFVQKLQIQYEQLRSSNIVSNDFAKKMLTASFLRQTIVMEARTTLTNL